MSSLGSRTERRCTMQWASIVLFRERTRFFQKGSIAMPPMVGAHSKGSGAAAVSRLFATHG
jgi:hypothetical protein